MAPIAIKDNIYWVGAVDWDIRDFHGYSTFKGTTYNAFLIMDEKICLVDTVKYPFRKELLDRIREIIDPRRIDYLIVNHVEPDHAGSVQEIVEAIQPEKIFISAMGKKGLLAYGRPESWPYEVVGSGQTIALGQRHVNFLETRMLHWPDSMFSYIPEDKLLISSDAFGQHWATSERFDDEVEENELLGHAAKYYANILLLYSPLVQKLLAEVGKLGIEIDMIAPDHGLIWRQRPEQILAAYERWSKQETKAKAVVAFDTMWHSTEMMAKSISRGLTEAGMSVKVMNLKVTDRSEVMTEILDAKAILCGSSTLNNHLLPRMADLLTYMKGLKPANRIGAAFGSYGWSGEAVKQINQYLEETKIQLADPGLRVNYAPTAADLEACVALGRKVGEMVKAPA